MQKDFIEEVEGVVREINDTADKFAKPVRRRYRLLFTLLVVFGVSAILDGFRFFNEEVPLFRDYPIILIAIGILLLLLTGKLYKSLEKMK